MAKLDPSGSVHHPANRSLQQPIRPEGPGVGVSTRHQPLDVNVSPRGEPAL